MVFHLVSEIIRKGEGKSEIYIREVGTIYFGKQQIPGFRLRCLKVGREMGLWSLTRQVTRMLKNKFDKSGNDNQSDGSTMVSTRAGG